MVDSVFGNGTILTQAASMPKAEALAVTDGRIVAVGVWGDVEPLAGPETRRIDLEGGTLLPGFNDAHVHVWKVGQLLVSILDLRSVESLGDLLGRVRARHEELAPDTWLLGRGYNEALMAEGRQPTRDDLDRAAPGRPVALTRTCGHMMVVNSSALALAGIDDTTRSPAGGHIVRDARGRPTGLLQETAMGLAKAVMPDPSVSDCEAMIEAAHRSQLTKGLTSVTEAGAYADLVEAYRKLEREDRLRVRTNVMALRLSDEHVEPLPLPERFVSDRLRIDSVKMFADGGLSGATAALTRPYRHAGTKGLLRVRVDELEALAREARDAGLGVGIHAIGDAAIEAVVEAYERLGPAAGGTRYRIEHFGLPDGSQLARAARLGVIAVPQTVFIHSLGPNFRRYLTDDYLACTYPIRSMLDAGLTVALSSDAPVVSDDSPLLGIEAALSRRDLEGEPIAPAEAVTVEEALYAYTMGGALASGDASNRGSLEAGKWADMVWLDGNPLDATPAAPEALREIHVVKTFVSGEPVFEG